MKQWDEFHQKRQEEMGKEPPHNEVVKLVNTLKKNDCHKVLDHGCGTGRNLLYLKEKGFDVYGIDRSKFAIDQLIDQGVKRDHLTLGDIKKLPYKSNFFDALISVNVISHGNSKEVERYLDEVKRVVRPGGIIKLVLCSKQFLKKVSTKHTKKVDEGTYVNINTPDGNLEHHFFTKKEIKSFFKEQIILKNEYVDEYSPFMKRTMNHLIFICKNGD